MTDEFQKNRYFLERKRVKDRGVERNGKKEKRNGVCVCVCTAVCM